MRPRFTIAPTWEETALVELGAGIRHTSDVLDNTTFATFDPARRPPVPDDRLEGRTQRLHRR
jgi:hypothetical protein